MASTSPPSLRHTHPEELSRNLEAFPTPKIRTDDDVKRWTLTRGYHDYRVFLRRLNDAVIGRELPYIETEPSEAAQAVLLMLSTLDTWIEEIPPLPTPQRFGNLAFRTWGKRLEERADELLNTLLPTSHRIAVPYLLPYLLTSFGSFVRMDYGTGHETSFALFLLCLARLRFLQPEPEEERHIALTIFVKYLRLCWKLQDVYRLEPAGSHGVWGLDDSHVLGYIFGSGQLRGMAEIPVDAILRPPLQESNLYFISIMRIHAVKTGPFYEHSAQLHAIATSVPNWGKVNSGLFKMYEAEVLGKRVVVQHVPLGGLLEWDEDSSASEMQVSSTMPPPPVHGGVTQAPWASAKGSSSPGGGMAAPWASTRAASQQHTVGGMTTAPWAIQPSGADPTTLPSLRRPKPPAI